MTGARALPIFEPAAAEVGAAADAVARLAADPQALAWREEAREILAPAGTLLYVIGAQKAATTWIYAQLSRHPDVSLRALKEIHYWNSIRTSFALPRKYARPPSGWQVPAKRALYAALSPVSAKMRARRESFEAWTAMLTADPRDHRGYARFLMCGRGDRRIVGDITPNYSVLGREAFREMGALHDHVRFVFVMRDPVERLWSGVRHFIGVHRRKHSSEATARFLFDHAIADADDVARRLTDYRRTLTELEAAVPGAQILCLFYETMFDPAEMTRLGGFLGLDGFAPELGEQVNSSRQGEWMPTPEQRVAARQVLAPVYDFVAARFGDRVPAAWSGR